MKQFGISYLEYRCRICSTHGYEESHRLFCNNVLISGSCTQGLVAKSLTKAELYGVYDAMPLVSWARLFFEAQMVGILDKQNLNIGGNSIILQDNTSAIKLENNGKRSSTKRTRHINIRYFFVSGEIKNGNVQVIYCPTKETVADYFTKGLQGHLFRTHRNAILGITAEEVIEYKAAYAKAKLQAKQLL